MPVPGNMTTVESSNIDAVGRDGDDLYVRFRARGSAPPKTYCYDGLADEHHDVLCRTESPGRYFADNIKGFPGKPV